MPDLNLILDPVLSAGDRRTPVQRRLYAALRAAVLDGRLPAGTVLPASRELARELGLARNTVLYAYELLSSEGYVQASRRGTVVAAVMPRGAGRGTAVGEVPALSRRSGAWHRLRAPEQDALPFMPGVPALDAFPMRLWQRLHDRARQSVRAQERGYRHGAGEPELRQAIATYLRVARGVRCQADQVIVTDGTQQALDLCAHLLADHGDRAWIEHPGYGGARTAFLQAGLSLVPVTVDRDGLRADEALWHKAPPRLIYTSPSHQYPLGSVLSLPRRLALIERARAHGAWILEDDYDSEFRHEGPSLAAMQGLVEDAPVIYLGTFSKSMFPGLRLGFMVLPAAVADRAVAAVNDLVRRGHVDEQRALADFIGEGHFARHLRRMRRLYAARQAALRAALARHWPLEGSIVGGHCGMHLVLSLPHDRADDALVQAALAQGLSPRPLSAYGMGGTGGFNGLVLGYANTPEDAMERHVLTLAGC